MEEWATEGDLQREIRSERFHRLIAVLEMGSEAPQVNVEYVLLSDGLDYVAHIWGSEVT